MRFVAQNKEGTRFCYGENAPFLPRSDGIEFYAKNKGPFSKVKKNSALFAHEIYCLPVAGSECVIIKLIKAKKLECIVHRSFNK